MAIVWLRDPMTQVALGNCVASDAHGTSGRARPTIILGNEPTGARPTYDICMCSEAVERMHTTAENGSEETLIWST